MLDQTFDLEICEIRTSDTLGRLQGIKLRDVLGTERRFDIKLEYAKSTKTADNRLASAGFRVVFTLFQSLIQPISRDRRGNLILPKVPVLDIDANSMLNDRKERITISLRYDPRQKIENQEAYLARMKTYYHPRIAQKGQKSLMNTDKREKDTSSHITNLSKANSSLQTQVDALQK